MKKNTFYPQDLIITKIQVINIENFKTIKDIPSEVDIIYFADKYLDLKNSSGWDTTISEEANHRVIVLNDNRPLFRSQKNRQVFQELIHQHLEKSETQKILQDKSITHDREFFLPLQQGRIPQNQRMAPKFSQKDYEDFKTETQKHPIKLVMKQDPLKLISFFKNEGIKIENTKENDSQNITDLYYKGGDYDALPMTVSVINGDPDGLYHALGKNGALFSPAAYRKTVSELLESGRSLLKTSEIDEHYQKVSNAILTEVPMIHLGFGRQIIAYQTDRIKDLRDERTRHDFRFIYFKKK